MTDAADDAGDGDGGVCGYPGSTGPCGNPATEDSGRCWIETHTADPGDPPHSTSDGRGAPEGNDNSAGHGAPEGNTNGSLHTLYMDMVDRLKAMDGDQLELFQDVYPAIRSEFAHKSEAIAVACFIVIRQDLLLDAMEDPFERWTEDVTDSNGNKVGERDRRRLKAEVLEAVDALNKEVRLTFKSERDHQGGGAGATASDRSTLWDDTDGEADDYLPEEEGGEA